MKSSSSRRKFDEPVMEMFLRIKHPTLDTASITKELGLEPEECIDAGSTASKSGGRSLHSESYWIAELEVPSLADLAKNFTSMSPKPGFAVAEVGKYMSASEYDMHILIGLRTLETKQKFLREIAKGGGSITLLIQRNDQSAPVLLQQSLGKLSELGIGIEID